MFLDHLYIMTGPGAPQAEELIAAGLKEGPPNAHPGQGTANRRFFFQNFMLELLYINDETEVRSPSIARTRLWERSRFRETGFAPLGICLQLDAGEIPPFSVWKFAPPYLPEGMFFPIAENEAFPWEPMIFFLPPGFGAGKNIERENDAFLKSIEIGLPSNAEPSEALQYLLSHGLLQKSKGHFQAGRVKLDFGPGEWKSFLPELPLEIKGIGE